MLLLASGGAVPEFRLSPLVPKSRIWSMGILSVFLLAFGFLGSVQADTFRWQDPQGNVHYGDTPAADAEGIQRVNTFECKTEQCEADWQRYYEEAIAVNESIDEWLRELDAIRQKQDASVNRVSGGYVQTIVTPFIAPLYGPLVAVPFDRPRHGWDKPHPDLYVKQRFQRTRRSFQR